MIAADADQALVSVARELCCVIAVNHLWELLHQGAPDPCAKRTLLWHIRRNLLLHLKNPYYSSQRRLQALAAALSPRMFALLKGAARRLR
jgi:hypothetical protein